MIKNKKKHFSFIEVIIIVVITAVACGITTGIIFLNNQNIRGISYADLSNNEALREFLEVYASIITNYYDDVDEQELIMSAINAMMAHLGDDYTNFLSREATEEMMRKLSGEFDGIGIQIIAGNLIYRVFEDSPALEQGLRVNDLITRVNGVDVHNHSTTEISRLIQSSPNRIARITVLRDSRELNFEVPIRRLVIPSVEWRIIEERNQKIGFIHIETFSATTHTQFRDSLERMEREGITSLIIDVRNNSGGYLMGATKIADLFLERGRVIYGIEDRNQIKNFTSNTGERRTYNVILLGNAASASASEILIAALRDSYGARFVGETTFGKGKIQTTMDLDSGGMIKYTSARWLTPNGANIDGVGLKPDFEIKPDYSLRPRDRDDEQGWQNFNNHLIGIHEAQLRRAIELLIR